MKDYYKILEVNNGATHEQIKKSYRRLALKYHPDKTSYSGAAELFSQINEAYDVLSKPESRALFDLQLQGTTGTTHYSSQPIRPRKMKYRPRPVYKPKIDITPYVKYFRKISLACFIFAALVGVDYFLPNKVVKDNVNAIQIDRYKREYRLILASGSFGVNSPEITKIFSGQEVELSYTPIFKKLLKMSVIIEGEKYDYYVEISIYRSFSFAIIILLITAFIGAFQLKNTEVIMNFAIVNGVLLILLLAFMAIS